MVCRSYLAFWTSWMDQRVGLSSGSSCGKSKSCSSSRIGSSLASTVFTSRIYEEPERAQSQPDAAAAECSSREKTTATPVHRIPPFRGGSPPRPQAPERSGSPTETSTAAGRALMPSLKADIDAAQQKPFGAGRVAHAEICRCCTGLLHIPGVARIFPRLFRHKASVAKGRNLGGAPQAPARSSA